MMARSPARPIKPDHESHWNLRIAAARAAQTRTRLSFLASTVISVALLIAIFNFEFSWSRNFAYSAKEASQTEVINQNLDKAPNPQGTIQAELIKNWIDSGRMKISLLGVDIGGDDATIMGSLSLYILTIWFFYCIRRENHSIVRLLQDAGQTQDKELKLAVFHDINSYTVFTAIGADRAIDTLETPIYEKPPEAHNRPRFLFLIFLPVITVLLMMTIDITSLCRDAVARNTNHTLLHEITHSTETLWSLSKSLWAKGEESQLMNGKELTQLGMIEFVALFFFVLIFMNCNEIRKCEKATETVLAEFYKRHINPSLATKITKRRSLREYLTTLTWYAAAAVSITAAVIAFWFFCILIKKSPIMDCLV